jgi:GNAT superfamily N-acetyltransferase
MGSTYQVTLEQKAKGSDMATIVQGLLAYNATHAGEAGPNYLVVTVRDDAGTCVGGLVGATYLGWLQVHSVWLPEELRGRGHGAAVLAAAEAEAIRRGCPRACLETLSFQALPFYEKHGYSVFSKLDDFPPGSTKYSLSKSLL